MVKVLAIDGGGIRRVIPAIILNEIEYRTHRKIHQLFDLMVGTSTGRILPIGLNKPDSANPKQAQYSTEDLIEFYYRYGTKIFNPII